MGFNKVTSILMFGAIFTLAGCQKNERPFENNLPSYLKEVVAVRLNYRYEPDVPPPIDDKKNAAAEARNAAVQNDFDKNRPQELLDKTLTSPDGKRVLAVYHKVADMQSEFRLDMYSADGKILRKITADTMAVHFPDTILWSPDSSNVAFVAMLRAAQTETGEMPPNENGAVANNAVNSNTDVTDNAPVVTDDTNADSNTATTPLAPTPAPPTGVLTFRTEQIYLCNSDGDGVKAITQNEGLIYFYYVWAPDSSMLAALAATSREWQYLQYRAETNGEIFVPVGRPRLVEKTGRERRLDDGLTPVQPVWSPDSAKVAAAYDVQIRVYDAGGNSPTQAAIPLRNHLLISSQVFDREQQRKLDAAPGANVQPDANGQADSTPTTEPPLTTLPDEKMLVSYNPIVTLSWPSDDQLYFQTAYIRRMKNEADSVTSFPRWHRLILTPQAAAISK